MGDSSHIGPNHKTYTYLSVIWCISDCDMESPLHTGLLKYTARRRLISSDDEAGRLDEVITPSDCVAGPTCPSSSLVRSKKQPSPSQEPSRQTSRTEAKAGRKGSTSAMQQQSETPSLTGVSTGDVISGTSPPQPGSEVIINIIHTDNSAWNSDEDSNSVDSDTSTPDF